MIDPFEIWKMANTDGEGKRKLEKWKIIIMYRMNMKFPYSPFAHKL